MKRCPMTVMLCSCITLITGVSSAGSVMLEPKPATILNESARSSPSVLRAYPLSSVLSGKPTEWLQPERLSTDALVAIIDFVTCLVSTGIRFETKAFETRYIAPHMGGNRAVHVATLRYWVAKAFSADSISILPRDFVDTQLSSDPLCEPVVLDLTYFATDPEMRAQLLSYVQKLPQEGELRYNIMACMSARLALASSLDIAYEASSPRQAIDYLIGTSYWLTAFDESIPVKDRWKVTRTLCAVPGMPPLKLPF